MTLENTRRDKLQACSDIERHAGGEKGADDADQTTRDVVQGLKDLTDRQNMTLPTIQTTPCWLWTMDVACTLGWL